VSNFESGVIEPMPGMVPGALFGDVAEMDHSSQGGTAAFAMSPRYDSEIQSVFEILPSHNSGQPGPGGLVCRLAVGGLSRALQMTAQSAS
jgi:hypothetical protein